MGNWKIPSFSAQTKKRIRAHYAELRALITEDSKPPKTRKRSDPRRSVNLCNSFYFFVFLNNVLVILLYLSLFRIDFFFRCNPWGFSRSEKWCKRLEFKKSRILIFFPSWLIVLRGYEILEKNIVLRMDPWLPKKHVSRSQIWCLKLSWAWLVKKKPPISSKNQFRDDFWRFS